MGVQSPSKLASVSTGPLQPLSIIDIETNRRVGATRRFSNQGLDGIFTDSGVLPLLPSYAIDGSFENSCMRTYIT